MVKNEVVYGCGCKAASDNAAVYCPKHGNPERGRTGLEARCEFLNRENEAQKAVVEAARAWSLIDQQVADPDCPHQMLKELDHACYAVREALAALDAKEKT